MLLQLAPGRARARRHHVLVRQPRHRDVAGCVAARLPGRRRDADHGAGGEGGDRARGWARRSSSRARRRSSARPGPRPRRPRAGSRSCRRSITSGSSRARAPSASKSSSRRPTWRPSTCRPAAAACSPGSRRPSRAWRRTCASSASSPPCTPRMTRSLAAGHPVTVPGAAGIADGLLAVRPGDITFAHDPGVRRRNRHRRRRGDPRRGAVDVRSRAARGRAERRRHGRRGAGARHDDVVARRRDGGRDGRRPGRGRHQRRQRRDGGLQPLHHTAARPA